MDWVRGRDSKEVVTIVQVGGAGLNEARAVEMEGCGRM